MKHFSHPLSSMSDLPNPNWRPTCVYIPLNYVNNITKKMKHFFIQFYSLELYGKFSPNIFSLWLKSTDAEIVDTEGKL